jgi:outer membrane receptor protein involved in Fe transport
MHNLRSCFGSLLGCLLTTFVIAQQQTVRGTLLDKTTQKPVPFASVALYRPADSTAITGAITDTTGQFSMAGVVAGTYRLKTFFVGYKPLSYSVVVNSLPVDVGTLLIEADTRLLEAVRVTGQRADLLVRPDRQTYRAAQFQSAAGGTATDILRNLPGLTINAEGEVSLRGTNGFLVLLNGKPLQANLGTLLAQLPANSIESVEVISTPGARFDPDGKAGIIAIITKKGTTPGWSVQANAMIGLPSVNDFGNAHAPVRYSPDLTLNYRSDKLDLAFSTAYLRNDIAGRREGDVNTTIGNRFTRFPSVGERSFDRHTFTNRLGLAYVPNARNAYTLGLYYSRRSEDRLADIFYDNTKTDRRTGQLISRANYFNNNLVRKGGEFFTLNADYTRTFAGKATLTTSGFYEYDRIDGFTSNRNLNAPAYRDLLQYTLTTTDRPIQNARTNIDAVIPLGGGKLETGYQYRYQSDIGDYLYREQNGPVSSLLTIPPFSGRVAISNHIHGLYAQFGASSKTLDYAAGLRFEHSERVLRAPDNQTYPLTLRNLFPSVNLLYKPKEGLSWRAGFSRRVQRNSNFALNPLPEREHSETLEQGDPALLPEFVNLAEITMNLNIGRGKSTVPANRLGTLLATVYYQGIENVINRVNRVYADTILSRIFTNAGLAQRLGLELAADLKPTKAWSVYVGGNLFRYTIAGQLFRNEVIYDRAAWTYSLNLSTTVSLSPTLTMQANVNYLSWRITAQGEDSRFLTPNLSAKKVWLNGRLSAQVQWQNVGLGFLPTNEQRITTRGADFFTTTNYIQEKDIFLLNLSYSLRQLSKRTRLPGNEFGDKEF